MAELKTAYKKGGLGDRRIKDFLFEILNAELKPIRERRAELARDKTRIMKILQEGTAAANEVADETLREMKHAMKIDYFDML